MLSNWFPALALPVQWVTTVRGHTQLPHTCGEASRLLVSLKPGYFTKIPHTVKITFAPDLWDMENYSMACPPETDGPDYCATQNSSPPRTTLICDPNY
jgi:hypothetical protein